MIDLAILTLLAWGGAIGWKRGGYRTLLDCMSMGSAVAVVMFSVPLLKEQLVIGSFGYDLRYWIRQHMVFPTFGWKVGNEGIADQLYQLILVGIGAAAVWIGIQMVLQVYQTVWTKPFNSPLSSMAGALIGAAMGGVFSVYMVQCLGLLSWIRGLEGIDLYLAESCIIQLLMNTMAR